jgi:hypothetical protein
MTKEDYNELVRISQLMIIDGGEASNMMNMIRKYLDPNFYLCLNCPAQIRACHRRICNWLGMIAPPSEEIITIEEPVIKKKAGRPCVKCKDKK